ncbi:MAG TPA: FAD/NAD(P)-binding protein [Spirochaetota bacterium]|nr:FAD/NAD(P)-binding protein [Spirochaetota bacterium]OPZ38926.1 MAG: Anaerobic sulfite reductase subunit B [Spirochaetes bacterium ADurb.BinA120]HNU92671.1 FAD/NAD(P)-binding protein [Spirochaetota bacterium]HPI15160.1 FAD/NAD(P)-binding protein [Spirochaetota bacterium]HPV98400.1 FAD/NAD(P)-binding protein [Spirochaetota bacterium]
MSQVLNIQDGKIVTVPEVATIEEIRDEIREVKTFYLSIDNREIWSGFKYKSGQFIMLTVFGSGEFAVSLPPSPENDRFHITVRTVGKVTSALHALKPGDKVGIRGPFGNGFPFEEFKGKNLVYVAGGIGLIPLRSSIVHALQHKKDFGRVLVLHGARTPDDLMYKENLKEWQSFEGFETYITVDVSTPGWTGETGFVHTLFDKANLPIDNTVAFVCGPPVMFNTVIGELMKRGLSDENIYSTLERHMKCGVGKCQHCAVGRTLVCTDGPVYTYRQIKTLGEEI